MRWIKKQYEQNEVRFRTRFLIFPKTITNKDGKCEIRWLEKATWIERFIGYGSSGAEFWAEIDWVN